jgi:outer membrane PBP1 activator LpoA protein
MTDTFDKLKATLQDKKSLSNEEIQKIVDEHGEMTTEELIELEAERLEVEKADKSDEVSLDDYLAALKVLDDATEDSDEYKKAEVTVEKYEAGG